MLNVERDVLQVPGMLFDYSLRDRHHGGIDANCRLAAVAVFSMMPCPASCSPRWAIGRAVSQGWRGSGARLCELNPLS